MAITSISTPPHSIDLTKQHHDSSTIVKMLEQQDSSCASYILLNHNPLGSVTKELFLKLNSLPMLTHLDISWTAIGDDGMAVLAPLLNKLTHLTVRNAGITPLGAKHIGEYIALSSTLTFLDVGSNPINVQGLLSIGTSLGAHSPLTTLKAATIDTEDSYWSPEQATALADSLLSCRTLAHLDLSYNHFIYGAIAEVYIGGSLLDHTTTLLIKKLASVLHRIEFMVLPPKGSDSVPKWDELYSSAFKELQAQISTN
jgi:hypothetical protein